MRLALNLRSAVGLWLVLSALPGSSIAVPPADLVLLHGHVRTGSVHQPLAEAVAIRAGAIVYVGSDRGATPYTGPKTEILELRGQTVLPGLADTHVHPALGEFLHHRLCDVRGFTVEEGFAKLRHCAQIAPAGDWVVGYGWYDLDNAGYDALTRVQLDALVSDRKLAVISRDIHTLWVNSRTLREFGIDRETPNPAGGDIVRDPDTGEPTGMLIDAATRRIVDTIQHDSPYAASTAEITRSAMAHLNTLGITAILDAFVDEDAARTYRQLDLEGALTTRVTLAMPVLPSNYRTEIPRIAAQRARWHSAHVSLDYIKVLADGNGEVGLASLLNHDGAPETATAGYYTDAQMKELVALSEKAKLAIFVHVIGDGAARQVLDAIEVARHLQPRTGLRHTLTHLVWISDRDLPRFRRLGVLANIQEGWLAPAAFGGPPGYDYARSTAAGPLGPWLGGRLMPYRSLQRAGARLAAGSDWFYTDEDPWNDLEAGATAKDLGGTQAMIPQETIDVATLLIARTSGAAYQLYREHEIGTIAAGMRADLVVVNQDPLTVPVNVVHTTKTVMTLLDGKVIYRR